MKTKYLLLLSEIIDKMDIKEDLQNLDLSGNNIQDLNSINQYVANLELEKEDSKLTDLTLANNNLENIEKAVPDLTKK